MFSRQGILTLLAVLACLLGLLLVSIRPAARLLFRNQLSPAEIVAIDRHVRDPVSIPPSWQNVAPMPQDVRAALDKCERAFRAWSWHRRQFDPDSNPACYNAYIRMVRGIKLPAESWTSITDHAAFMVPIVTATEEL